MTPKTLLPDGLNIKSDYSWDTYVNLFLAVSCYLDNVKDLKCSRCLVLVAYKFEICKW